MAANHQSILGTLLDNAGFAARLQAAGEQGDCDTTDNALLEWRSLAGKRFKRTKAMAANAESRFKVRLLAVVLACVLGGRCCRSEPEDYHWFEFGISQMCSPNHH